LIRRIYAANAYGYIKKLTLPLRGKSRIIMKNSEKEGHDKKTKNGNIICLFDKKKI
jgi:hypothetical protein